MSIDISFKRSHEESFMLIEGKAQSNAFEEKMLKNNQIKSLTMFYTMQVNDKTQFWYRITGKESLKDYLNHQTLTLELLEKVLLYLSTACEEINRYTISQEHILISPESIYMEKKDQSLEMFLCYCPFPLGTFVEQFRSITEYLLTIADPDVNVVNEVCYDLYEESMKEDYSLGGLIKLIQEKRLLETNIYVEKIEKDIQSSQCDNNSGYLNPDRTEAAEFSYDFYDEDEMVEEDEKESFFSRIFGKRSRLNRKERRKAKKAAKSSRRGKRSERDTDTDNELDRKTDFEFEVSPEEELYTPTVLLKDVANFCAGKLMYDGQGAEDDYMIDKDIFRIGSHNGKNEAVLHSKAVSHHHARITRQGNDYYIEDLNSTNGTFLNGEILPYAQTKKLSAMDRIMFADVAYVFM